MLARKEAPSTRRTPAGDAAPTVRAKATPKPTTWTANASRAQSLAQALVGTDSFPKRSTPATAMRKERAMAAGQINQVLARSARYVVSLLRL
jgi:hypothetical protein